MAVSGSAFTRPCPSQDLWGIPIWAAGPETEARSELVCFSFRRRCGLEGVSGRGLAKYAGTPGPGPQPACPQPSAQPAPRPTALPGVQVARWRRVAFGAVGPWSSQQ